MTNPVTDGRFVELLTSTQVRLRSYALTMVPNNTDADDVVQAACLAMWEKRSQFDAERSFFSWGCGFVLKEVLRLRRKKATDRLMFGESLLNMLATEYLASVDELDLRREQLTRCVQKLCAADRELLSERYTAGTKPKQIANKRGMPATTIYSALSRIRDSLHHCIEVNAAQGTHPKL